MSYEFVSYRPGVARFRVGLIGPWLVMFRRIGAPVPRPPGPPTAAPVPPEAPSAASVPPEAPSAAPVPPEAPSAAPKRRGRSKKERALVS